MADEKKPRRRRRKKDAEAAEPREPEAAETADATEEASPEPEGDELVAEEATEAEAGEASGDDAGDEGPEAADEEEPQAADEKEPEAAEEEEPEADGAEAKPKRGRRRAAETSTPKKKKDEPSRPAPRDASGAVAVRAQAKYVRRAPRKARLVMDHIRGKDVSQARAILRHTPRGAAEDILKLLDSAVANAENNFELDPDELRIGRAVVDDGPTLKRYRPRALGRATPIHKRTSHMTITLTTTGDER
jgi:ribosomal protein L22